MSKKRFYYLLFTLCLLITVFGCSSDQIITPKDPRSMKYPVQVKDATGELIKIEQEPKRIVSIVPSTTEIAFALKLEKEVVAVTTNDDYPAAVKKLPKVGDMKINIEQVVAQKPDLVLASTVNDKNTIQKLRDLKIPVIVTGGQQIKQVYQAIDTISIATNRTWEAEQLIAKMEKDRREIYSKVVQIPQDKRVKVWIEVGPELFTVGGDDFLHELVTLAGGVNVAGKEKGWPKMSAEQVVKWQPDVILSTYGGEQNILQRKGWETVPAIQNKRVHAVDPNLTTRPGPRLTEGIQELAKIFYPERFTGSEK